MQRKHLAYGVIILLLLLNTGILLFVFIGPGHGRHDPRRFDRLVITTLDLDVVQQQQFELLKKQHHELILEEDRSMHELYIAYFDLLDNGSGMTVAKDSLEQLISGAYNRKVKATFQHFELLRAICRPEQRKRFERLVPELMNVISPPEEKR